MFVAAKYADELNCKAGPVFDDEINTDIEQKVSGIVLKVMKRKLFEACERNWALSFKKNNAHQYEFKLDLGFEFKDGRLQGNPFQALVFLLSLFPAASLTAKRFHDFSRSSKIFIYPVIVGVGMASLVFFDRNNPTFLFILGLLIVALSIVAAMIAASVIRGEIGSNKYGPDPLVGAA